MLFSESVSVSRPMSSAAGPEIGDHSHIGLGAAVLPGRTIGRNCIVGAGSVVTEHIPDGPV